MPFTDADRPAVQKRIKEILADYGNDQQVDSVHDRTNIQEHFDLDSLDRTDIVMAIEEEFQLEIPFDDAERLQTFEQITDYVIVHGAS